MPLNEFPRPRRRERHLKQSSHKIEGFPAIITQLADESWRVSVAGVGQFTGKTEADALAAAVDGARQEKKEADALPAAKGPPPHPDAI